MTTRIAAAVERALDDRQKDAQAEVERVLDAAVLVIEQAAPAVPRVNDILKQAGVSNTAFYRYFSGKDDLMLALAERGIGLVASFLEHEMSKATDPKDKVARWIEGLLAQVRNPRLSKINRVVSIQLGTSTEASLVAEEEINRPLRDLLAAEIATIDGIQEPGVGTEAIFAMVMGKLRRHVILETMPEVDEIHKLVDFCLRGLGADDTTNRRRR